MQIIKVDPEKPKLSIVKQAAQVIKQGGVIICPSDTCYIFAASIFEKEAVERIFALKGRGLHKPLGVMVATIEMAQKIVVLNDYAKMLYQKFFPGPLTVVSEKKSVVGDFVTAGKPTLGISIPGREFPLLLAETAKIPYTGTSANKTGLPPAFSLTQLYQQFEKDELKVDLIVDGGQLPVVPLTSVIDTTKEPPIIIREGAIKISI